MSATGSSTLGAGGDGLIIRPCAADDVRSIELNEPPGRRYAGTTFARQVEGSCTYLVAWLGNEPVGSGELELGSPPELKNLHVLPMHRRHGIGRALIERAETLAAGSGRIRIGVADDNPDAARLYSQLEYSATGESLTYSYAYVDDDGVTREAVETSRYLEKVLILDDEPPLDDEQQAAEMRDRPSACPRSSTR